MWTVKVEYNAADETQTQPVSELLGLPFTLPKPYLLPASKYGIGRNRTSNFIMLDSVHVSRDQLEILTDSAADSNGLRIIVKSRAKSTINGVVHLLNSSEAKSSSYKTIAYSENKITIQINRYTIRLKWVATLRVLCHDDEIKNQLQSRVPLVFASSLENADVCLSSSYSEQLRCLALGVGVFLDPPTEWLQLINVSEDLIWYEQYQKYLVHPLRDRKLLLSTIKCIVRDRDVSLALASLGGTVVDDVSHLVVGDSFFIVDDFLNDTGTTYSTTLLEQLCKAMGTCDLTMLDIHKMRAGLSTKRSLETSQSSDAPASVPSRRKRRKYAKIDQLEFLDFSQTQTQTETQNPELQLVESLPTTKEEPEPEPEPEKETPTKGTKQLQTESLDSIEDQQEKSPSQDTTRAIENEHQEATETLQDLPPQPRLAKRKLSESTDETTKRMKMISLVEAVKQSKLQSVHNIKVQLGIDDKSQEKDSGDTVVAVQIVDMQLRQKPKQPRRRDEPSNGDRKNFKRFVKNKKPTPAIARKYVDMDPVTVSHGYKLVDPLKMVNRIDYEQHLQHDFEGLIGDVSNAPVYEEEQTLFVPEIESIIKHPINHATNTSSLKAASSAPQNTHGHNDADDDDDDDDDSQPRFAFRQT